MIVGALLLVIQLLSGASRIETIGVIALDGIAARVLVGAAVSIAGLLLWLIVQSSGVPLFLVRSARRKEKEGTSS